MKDDHFDGTHFYNLDPAIKQKGFFDVLKWKLFEKRTPWPQQIQNTDIPLLPAKIEPNEVFITFINHASELIQVHGLNILTDPLFSMRCSPFSWLGPKRVCAPGIELNDLPKIDIVIISHNHYDHLDISSLNLLAKKDDPLFILPLNNAYILRNAGISKILELDWWQNHKINAAQSIMLVPSQHWSRRSAFDTNCSLWGSYVLNSNDLKIFFAGDTGFGSHFKLINDRLGAMDVSILPIGSYEPRWFMKSVHLNPEDAVKAHLDLGAKLSIGMHYGSFQLTDEGYDEPIIALKESLNKHHLSEEVFLTPGNGKTIFFKK